MNKREMERFTVKSRQGKSVTIIALEVSVPGSHGSKDKILSEPWFETEAGLRVKKVDSMQYEIVATNRRFGGWFETGLCSSVSYSERALTRRYFAQPDESTTQVYTLPCNYFDAVFRGGASHLSIIS